MPGSAARAYAPRADRCAPRRPLRRRIRATARSRVRVFGREKVLAVVAELADGFLDISERLVFALLGESRDDSRRPATRQLLHRAHVEIAVVEEFLQRGH